MDDRPGQERKLFQKVFAFEDAGAIVCEHRHTAFRAEWSVTTFCERDLPKHGASLVVPC